MPDYPREPMTQHCPVTGHQIIDVSLPVTVTPFGCVGRTVTKCCGAPTIIPGACGEGAQCGSCVFTITQRLCVSVPVLFGAMVDTGETFVNCGGVSVDDICAECEGE